MLGCKHDTFQTLKENEACLQISVSVTVCMRTVAVPSDHQSLICLNPSSVTLLYATHTAVRADHTKQHCCGRRIPWSCSLTHTHTHTQSQIPIASPLDIHTQTGGWVSMETCTMQQEPVEKGVYLSTHLTTARRPYVGSVSTNAAALILHPSISMPWVA